MLQIIVIACLVIFVRMLKKEGVFDKTRSSKVQSYLIPVKGILAWSVVVLLLWGAWHIYLILDVVIEAPLSLSSAWAIGELALILYGVCFAYQSIITLSESGDMHSMRFAFVQILRFQSVKKRLEVDKNAEPIELQKYIKEQQVQEKQEAKDKHGPESDVEKYFGS